jgi:hypothetical protein
MQDNRKDRDLRNQEDQKRPGGSQSKNTDNKSRTDRSNTDSGKKRNVSLNEDESTELRNKDKQGQQRGSQERRGLGSERSTEKEK